MKPGSLFFYIPHHPLEWAADLESEHRYTDQRHTHSVSDGYGGMLTLYPENDHHGPPSTNRYTFYGSVLVFMRWLIGLYGRVFNKQTI